MRRSLALLGGLMVTVLTLASGCGCDSYCDDDAERQTFTGELLESNGSVFTFAHVDGPRQVGVTGHENFLEVGREYQVTAARFVRTDVEWASHVNGGCGCKELNITHADGVGIDTGFVARLNKVFPFKKVAYGLLAIPVATMVLVSVHRLVVGRDRDLMRDMPFDEWVDIED